MKTILKSATVFALMLTAAVGLAKEPKLSLMASDGTKTLQLELDTVSSETAIRFLDAAGNVIFSDKIKDGKTFGKQFNLNYLETGLYFLELEDPIKEITYTIDVEEGSPLILDRKEKVKPVFRRKGDLIFLNFLNLDSGDVKVWVTDSSDRVVFTEVIDGEMIIEKVFNFENAYEDHYTLMVKDKEATYYEYIEVD